MHLHMLLWKKKLGFKDDKGQGRWFQGCNETPGLHMTAYRKVLDIVRQTKPWTFIQVMNSPLGLWLIFSITWLKSLSHFTPLFTFWETLCTQEMITPVVSIAHATALSRGETNKFQSLLFPFWTNPS